MTIPSIFREYLWLIKTIQNAGRISLREINQKWLEEDFSEGIEIARTTFVRHRSAIEQMFGIRIGCDRKNGNAYYIENEQVLRDDTIQHWMLNTLTVNNIILDSISLQDRIFLESIPAVGCLKVIVEAMKKCDKLFITYNNMRQQKRLNVSSSHTSLNFIKGDGT